jgi:hypothetical protein
MIGRNKRKLEEIKKDYGGRVMDIPLGDGAPPTGGLLLINGPVNETIEGAHYRPLHKYLRLVIATAL